MPEIRLNAPPWYKPDDFLDESQSTILHCPNRQKDKMISEHQLGQVITVLLLTRGDSCTL